MSVEKIGSVAFQLDYYPSSQFAGLHLALKSGLYAAKGLDVVLLPPTAAGGEEPELVVQKQREFDMESGSSYSNFPAGAYKSLPKVCIGSAEQSVILGAIARNVQVKGFATIFQSRMALNSPEDLAGKAIGMHIDSHELTACLLSHATEKFKDISVRVDERATKLDALMAKEVNAIQVYSCYETVELEMKLGSPPACISLSALTPESATNFCLGYGQALFTAGWTLRSIAACEVIRKFLEATQEGWLAAAKDPQAAVDAILEARAAAGYLTRSEFEVVNSAEFIRRSLSKCLDLVIPPAAGSNLLHVDPAQWQRSANDLFRIGYLPCPVANAVSFFPCLWAAPAAPATPPAPAATKGTVADGLAIAAQMRKDAAARAAAFARRNGRRPRLAVIRVGGEKAEAKERLELFSREDTSWFSKHVPVQAAGIDYESIVLPVGTSFKAVLRHIHALNRRGDIDAILLERPLAGGLNADALGAHILPSKDVDCELSSPLPGTRGAAPVQAFSGAFTDLSGLPDCGLPDGGELAGGGDVVAGALPAPWLARDGGPALPIFAAAAMHMLDVSGHADRLPGGRAVVIGRSRRLGLPLALALMQRDATVTVCHSSTPAADLRAACAAADVLLVAAGAPGLVTADMVKPGAAVVNLGTTFDRALGRLLPDVDPAVAAVAGFSTPTPHGMGPLMVAALIESAVGCAEARALVDRVRRRHKEATAHAARDAYAAPSAEELAVLAAAGWARTADGKAVTKAFRFPDFAAAVDAVGELRAAAEEMNHHPTLAINRERQCEQVAGCAVEVDLTTYSAGAVTRADAALARAIDALFA